MSKFKIVRKYPLAFLGEGWEECYLQFRPFTIAEIDTELTGLATTDTKDAKSIASATKTTVKLLKDHFVGGRALTDEGLVDVKPEDLVEMPAEVLGGALNFLSAGPTTISNPS